MKSKYSINPYFAAWLIIFVGLIAAAFTLPILWVPVIIIIVAVVGALVWAWKIEP